MLNLLVSWPYLVPDVLETWVNDRHHIRMLIDSGAFTNWKAGEDTCVQDYIAFIKGLPIEPDRYFTLDRIGDPEGSWDNYRAMLDAGLNPVPIFTRGSDIADLDRMYETSDLVGIGGLVGTGKSRGYLRWVLDQNNGRPMHWLGVATPNLIASYQPASCDSSGWESGGRYGNAQVYIGGGVFEGYTRQDSKVRPPGRRMWQRIRQMGFDPRALQKEQNWRGTWSVARRLGCASWVRYMLDAEQRFGARCHLAFCNQQALENCLIEYKKAIRA
jgi:hypothetical protein